MKIDPQHDKGTARGTASYCKSIFLRTLVLIALVLIVYPRLRPPLEYPQPRTDEGPYTRASTELYSFIREGNPAGIINYSYNLEHPAWVKLSVALSYFVLPSDTEKQRLQSGRWVAFCNHVGAAIAVSFISVLGALLFLLSGYGWLAGTSYGLESAYIFYSTVALVLALRSRPTDSRHLLLILSGVFAGLGLASKYSALIPCLGLTLYLVRTRSMRQFSLWAFCVVATFLLANPQFWFAPYNFVDSIAFHFKYSQSAHVLKHSSKDPFYTVRAVFGNRLGFTGASVIMWIGILSIPILLKRAAPFAIWAAIGIIALTLWNTKWLQYGHLILLPLSLSCAVGIEWLVTSLISLWKSRIRYSTQG